jgi:GNAT superfamily N-acetyltransferase
MPSQRLWAFEAGALWALDARDAPPAPPASTSGAAISEANVADTKTLAWMMGVERGEVEQRFTASSRCFVARVAGALAGYGWVSHGTERIGELERSLRMKPGEAYIWDCMTLPPYRGQGVYTALLRAIIATLRDEGGGRLWIGASLTNRPSLKAFARAGFRPALTIFYLRLGRSAYSWVTRALDVSPELYADARWALLDERAPARGRLANG